MTDYRQFLADYYHIMNYNDRLSPVMNNYDSKMTDYNLLMTDYCQFLADYYHIMNHNDRYSPVMTNYDPKMTDCQQSITEYQQICNAINDKLSPMIIKRQIFIIDFQ